MPSPARPGRLPLSATRVAFVSIAVLLAGVSAQAQVMWRDYVSGPNGTWNSVAYGNDTFVTVGTQSKVATSDDGLNWLQRDPGLANVTFFDVEYGQISTGNWGFMAIGRIGTTNYTFTSSDGVSWTNVSASYPASAGVSRRKIGVGPNGELSLQTSGQAPYTIAYGNGNYVGLRAGSSSTDIYTSANGTSFTLAVDNYSQMGYQILHTGDAFLVTGAADAVYSLSETGLDWDNPQPIVDGATGNIGALLVADAMIWAVGNSTTSEATNIFYSSDGQSWVRDAVDNAAERLYDLGDIAYGDNIYVAVGTGAILTKTAVPEPAHFAAGLGLAVLALAQWRRRRG